MNEPGLFLEPHPKPQQYATGHSSLRQASRLALTELLSVLIYPSEYHSPFVHQQSLPNSAYVYTAIRHLGLAHAK